MWVYFMVLCLIYSLHAQTQYSGSRSLNSVIYQTPNECLDFEFFDQVTLRCQTCP